MHRPLGKLKPGKLFSVLAIQILNLKSVFHLLSLLSKKLQKVW